MFNCFIAFLVYSVHEGSDSLLRYSVLNQVNTEGNAHVLHRAKQSKPTHVARV